MKRPFEKVYTVSRYHDGPRSGVADFNGKPHLYEWEWDNDTDDYGQVCTLSPITEKTFHLVLEDWEMWIRWKTAFKQGKALQDVSIEEHPVLPEDQARHREIAPILKKSLSVNPSQKIKAIGRFKSASGSSRPSSDGPWEVSWEPC